MMEIARDYYRNKLIARKHNGLIKIITGIRRCGKSYLLNPLFKRHLLSEGVPDDHIVEMAFDSFENETYCDPKVFYAFAKGRIKDGEMHYFLLDEVQLLQKFESVLNSLIRLPNVDIYVTGSNAKFLSKDVITEFSGRGDEVHLNPLSFSEFMAAYDGTLDRGWNEYLLYGGLPPVALLPDAEQKVSLLDRLLAETYISDIVKRNRIRNVSEMEDLLNLLASNIGAMTNPNKLQNTFKSVKKSKITAATISKYLTYLGDAYLIEHAKRYDIKGKAYIESPSKYYFTDLGLRNARIHFRQMEVTHIMENVIYNELRMRGFHVDVGSVPVMEKNKAGVPVRKQLEVDFVCNQGSKRYYVQSAYAMPDEAKQEQEMRSLRRIDDSFKKIIVSRDAPDPLYNEYGILTMNLFDFLLNPDSLEF